jgi:hypothetical protein
MISPTLVAREKKSIKNRTGAHESTTGEHDRAPQPGEIVKTFERRDSVVECGCPLPLWNEAARYDPSCVCAQKLSFA